MKSNSKNKLISGCRKNSACSSKRDSQGSVESIEFIIKRNNSFQEPDKKKREIIEKEFRILEYFKKNHIKTLTNPEDKVKKYYRSREFHVT